MAFDKILSAYQSFISVCIQDGKFIRQLITELMTENMDCLGGHVLYHDIKAKHNAMQATNNRFRDLQISMSD